MNKLFYLMRNECIKNVNISYYYFWFSELTRMCLPRTNNEKERAKFLWLVKKYNLGLFYMFFNRRLKRKDWVCQVIASRATEMMGWGYHQQLISIDFKFDNNLLYLKLSWLLTEKLYENLELQVLFGIYNFTEVTKTYI